MTVFFGLGMVFDVAFVIAPYCFATEHNSLESPFHGFWRPLVLGANTAIHYSKCMGKVENLISNNSRKIRNLKYLRIKN